MAWFKKQYVDNAEAVKWLMGDTPDGKPDPEIVNLFVGRVNEDPKSQPGKPPSEKLHIEIKTKGLKYTVGAEVGSVQFPHMFKKDTPVQFCLDLKEKSGRKADKTYLERGGAGNIYVQVDIDEAVRLTSLVEPYDNIDAVKMIENGAGELDFTGSSTMRFAGIVKEEPTDHIHTAPDGTTNTNEELDFEIKSPSLKLPVKAMGGSTHAEVRYLFRKGTPVQFNLDMREKDGTTAAGIWFTNMVRYGGQGPAFPNVNMDWRPRMNHG